MLPAQSETGAALQCYFPSFLQKRFIGCQTSFFRDKTFFCFFIIADVATHECGHVCQHEEGYAPLAICTALAPIANFGSNAGIWIVILSLLLGLAYPFAMIGVVLFSFGVLFQIVTLPVEFNASSRGLRMLDQYGVLTTDEMTMVRKVLRAAALTYVAAAASSILQLLRLLLIVGGRRRD